MQTANKKTIYYGLTVLVTMILAGLLYLSANREQKSAEPDTDHHLKLYWFIPDGLRAEPTIFKIFDWAAEGKLPNLKKMMELGSWGYSMPVFPGHTPTNFATLLTGSTPKVHGIADGPMHIEGYPLKMVSKGGFSSVAKKVPPIWYTLEERGLIATVLSVPGSTPPELDSGITIRGRWGGWGVDFPAVIFHSGADLALRKTQAMDNRVFSYGSELTRYIDPTDLADWQLDLPPTFSPAKEAALANWGTTIFALFYDTTDNGVADYDRVLFSADKNTVMADLGTGDWSSWLPVTLEWELQNDYNIHTPKRMAWERSLSAITVATTTSFCVIDARPESFRLRFLYDNLNQYLVKPSFLSREIGEALGPMVDFPDNYPPQLIYTEGDRATFLEESRRSLTWHRKAAAWLTKNSNSDLIIHDTYTPNQMLTSRWWMAHLDPASSRYAATDEATREERRQEVMEMYQGIDQILGEIMKGADPDTVIVFSSDHGILPLNQEVLLNNFLAAHGLLNFTVDQFTGTYVIDWAKTKAVFLKMDNIYLNPAGLDGNYHRASGPAYDKLRQEVIRLVKEELKDSEGNSPLERIVKWEDAATELGLPADRVGDLVIANHPGYNWIEDLTSQQEVFRDSLKSGYKQAIIPESSEGMLTPFVIMGPGVKKGFQLPEIIRHIDQYPTIMTLLDQPVPDFVEGRPRIELFTGN
ncbi:MAG: alkaline phosphatase family protein [Proteobacteria bacterium]|nr:alkaline phosphatase family protein [Pseudomonadota bacterium]MBU1715977.1 alkaline phosphatase family protein [Pseudomonadota bacterium]